MSDPKASPFFMPQTQTSKASHRVPQAFSLRTAAAAHDASVPAPAQIDNGDEARYSDKCGTYTKCLRQSGFGVVDPSAYASFRAALDSGHPAGFNEIILGGTRTLNGPQGGLAFDLQCLDVSQFAVPPAPALASEEYAAELTELYWASLLRDVAFANYSSNALAQQASSELSFLSSYQGPRDATGKVTPDLLFRGPFAGETDGPYLSQFLLKSTCIGAMPVTQKYTTFQANVDYVVTPNDFLKVQNGIATGQTLQPQDPVYLHNGRGLAAFTHNDVLYQAYLTAYLVLNSLNGASCATGDNPAKLNPGNPYVPKNPHGEWKTQNGFTTFGQPDIASTLAAVASEALKAVWFQKWFVHLRHRPESGGGIVHLSKTGQQDSVEGKLSPTVLNSQAVQTSFNKFGTYFLTQAFPEGSPAHPAYPTGHGAVAGACITVLKFFYDGAQTVPNPQVPPDGGSGLSSYSGPPLTVNGELHKLATNISFGHGIHAGIHWRSDTVTSIDLGEAVALSVLHDRARTYNEKFTVHLTKLDGTVATISNE